MFEIIHLYISPGHNFYGHYGKPPGDHATVEVDEVECVAGKGLMGDRFFDYKPDYKGQITFFAHEVYEALSEELGVTDKDTSVFRRNAITRGIDLNTLIGKTFEVQDVEFEGVEECRPCLWMNQAFGPEAEERLRGRGGLRCRILTDGTLRRSSK